MCDKNHKLIQNQKDRKGRQMGKKGKGNLLGQKVGDKKDNM